MTDEEIVAALAEELIEARWWKEQPVTEVAAVLLPVVRRVAEQRAAEELRAAAEELRQRGVGPEVFVVDDRAAALTATPNHGTDATT